MDTQTIINEQINTVKELRAEITRLKDSMVGMKQGTEEWGEASEKLYTAQSKMNDINRAAKGIAASYNNENMSTINGLKERIRLLNQERNNMDMSSKEYQDATARLKEMNDQLRESGTSAGDWRANVGNYADSITTAFGQLGSAAQGLTGSMGGLNKSMLALCANPIGAVIAAIALAFNALAKGIKSSEDNTSKFNQILAPLKGLLTVIQRGTQQLAGRLLDAAKGFKESGNGAKVLNGIIKVLSVPLAVVRKSFENLKVAFDKIKGPIREAGEAMNKWLKEPLDWLYKQYGKLANTKLGRILGLPTPEELKKEEERLTAAAEKVKEVSDAIAALDAREAELNKKRRERETANAQDQGRIETIREEVAELQNLIAATDDVNKKRELAEKAIAKLNEAKRIQKAMDERAIATAKEEYEIIQKRNSLSDSSTKDLDAEADAKVNLINATNAATASQTSYDKQMKQLYSRTKETGKAIEDMADAEDDAKNRTDAYKEALAELNAQFEKLQLNYEETMNDLSDVSSLEANEATIEAINRYYDDLALKYDAEYDAYAAMTDAKIAKLEEFIEVQRAMGNDTVAQENQLSRMRMQKDKEYRKHISQMEALDKNRTKAVKNNYAQQISAYGQLLEAMSGLMEENTIAYKTTAMAKAIIDTYLAANNALAALPPPASYVAAAASIATGLANVAMIWKTNAKGETKVPSDTSSVVPQIIESQPYTYTRNATTIEEEETLNQPIYVSVTDINNMQNKVKVREEESTF